MEQFDIQNKIYEKKEEILIDIEYNFQVLKFNLENN